MTYALAAALILAAPAPGSAPAGSSAVPDAPAEVASGGATVRIAGAGDVARLCRALEPTERLRPTGDALARGEAAASHDAERRASLAARYEVVVPAANLSFAPYDGPERRLSLSAPVQLPVADGAARAWPVTERELAVVADAATARRILDSQRNGALSLVLTFDLPEDAACSPGARGTAPAFPMEPVSWRWVEGEAVLARGGAGADRPLLTLADGAVPRVDVGEPLAGPVEAKKAVLSRSAELEACYAEALKRDPGIDGVLVADLGGQDPAIAADSVGDEELAACVRRALGPLASRGGKVAVPIRFELESPEAAKARAAEQAR